MDQWMNNRSDTALVFSTNSKEKIVIALSKNRAHEQAHWRATIFMSIAKTLAGARFVADPNTIYRTASHLIPEIRKELGSFLADFREI